MKYDELSRIGKDQTAYKLYHANSLKKKFDFKNLVIFLKRKKDRKERKRKYN